MPTLYTLDSTDLTPDAVEAWATQAGVSTIADVRRRPAPAPGLAADRLAERLEGAGVGYVRLDGLVGAPGGDAADDYAVLRGLVLDEDVCLLGDGGEEVLAEGLAEDTGLPVVHLHA